MRPGIVELAAQHGKPGALSGWLSATDGTFSVSLQYAPSDFVSTTPLVPGQAASAHGTNRTELVYANASNLEKIRKKRKTDYLVGDAVICLDPAGDKIEVIFDGLKVGQFSVGDRARFLDAVKAWNRPLTVTLKAGDHSGCSSWEARIEMDNRLILTGGT
jgi:hypothetical protein